MSVEEALKSPEFQLPLSKTAVPAPLTNKSAKQEAVVCIDLTDSDDEKESEPKPAVASAGQLQAKAGSSGLQLGSSGGLQLGSGGLKLGTPGGLQLGSSSANAGMSTISGASSVLPVKLDAPVSASGQSTTLKLHVNKTDSTSGVPTLKPLAQFAPPSGSWECDQCMVRNQAKDDKCVACTAPRPSSKTTDTTKPTMPSFKPLAQFAPPSDSWECDQCMVRNQAKDDKCVACTASKPSVLKSTMAADSKSATAPPPTVFFKPLAQFAPPSGSWECDQCMVSNKATDKSCVACGAPKPGKKNVSVTLSGASKPGGGSGTLSLGAPVILGVTVKQPVEGNWSCEVCLVQNKAEDSKCIACTAPKPGAGGKATLSEAPPTSTAAKWTCGTCLVVNKVEDTKCVACSGPKVSKPSLPPKVSSITPLTGFAPPAGSWTCDTCLVQNKAEDTKCVSCSTPKPGAKPVSELGTDSNKNSTSGGLTMGASGGLKLGGGLLLSGVNFGQGGGLKLLGSGGKESQATTAGAGGGGIKITASLSSSLVQGKNDKKPAPESKEGGSSGGLIGLSAVPGSAPATSSEGGQAQASISQLAEKNPLAGIKFGATAATSTSTASSQNPLTGIKFGTSTTTTPAASLQINFGTTSSSSSPFKLGSGVMVSEQTGGLKIGGATSSSPSSSMETGGILSGIQPTVSGTAAANPLAGLKFGVPATQSSSSSGSAKLQLPSQSQLQFGTMAPSTANSSGLFGLSSSTASTTTSSSSQSSIFASSASGLSANAPSLLTFSGATKPDSSNSNKPALIQFGALPATQASLLQPASTTSTSSSLFVFSGSKDASSKIDSSSPFPSAGSASSSLGGFGATGGIGMGTGSGTGTGLGGGAQPLKLNFGASQPASTQPFVFGGNSSSGTAQSQGLSLIGELSS